VGTPSGPTDDEPISRRISGLKVRDHGTDIEAVQPSVFLARRAHPANHVIFDHGSIS